MRREDREPQKRTRPPADATATTKVIGVVASEARTAILFRRGPRRHVQMLRWDLRTDTLTAGQWLVGQVHTEACSVSPRHATFEPAWAPVP